MTDPEQTERSTAEPITVVLADRVRQLRERSGMSQAELAERMTMLGRPWKRATVVNVEKRGTTSRKRGTAAGRDAVTVQELLDLALVLDVPPIWLLADPEEGTAVPIAEGIEVDPWTALMWLTGCQPLEGPGGESRHTTAYLALSHLNTLARLLDQYHQFRRMLDLPVVSVPVPIEGDVVAGAGVVTVLGDPAEMRRTTEAAEATTLRAIADHLGQFRALQVSVPPVPPDVRKRAAELGIELPGQEG